jgi:hypothetical protein
MRFGDLVVVHRGSPGNPPGAPGSLREVKGVLIGALGPQKLVRLLQDDPLATVGYCTKKGEKGWWSTSQVAAWNPTR